MTPKIKPSTSKTAGMDSTPRRDVSFHQESCCFQPADRFDVSPTLFRCHPRNIRCGSLNHPRRPHLIPRSSIIERRRPVSYSGGSFLVGPDWANPKIRLAVRMLTVRHSGLLKDEHDAELDADNHQITGNFSRFHGSTLHLGRGCLATPSSTSQIIGR